MIETEATWDWLVGAAFSKEVEWLGKDCEDGASFLKNSENGILCRRWERLGMCPEQQDTRSG